MGLDYAHTCPEIDREIKEIKQSFFDSIKQLLEQNGDEDLTEQDIKDIAENYSNSLYGDIESHFEAVRGTNEDMRKEADYQIENLEDKIQQLEGANEDLQNDIDSQRNEIASLESILKPYLKR